MADDGDRLLAELIRFIHEIEQEEKRNPSSVQVAPSEAFDGQWLRRWRKLIRRAELYLANRPN